VYRAGDALSFVDPFTGSGLLSAVSTGAAAGFGAATGQSQSAYQARCREILERPFGISTLLRISVEKGWAEGLLWLAPAQLLFRATRPRVQCAACGDHSGERQ